MIFFLSISVNIHLQIRREECSVLVLVHWYSCPDFLIFCARMRSTCSLPYCCLFPSLIFQLQVQHSIPISCVLCARVYATTKHNTLLFFIHKIVSLTHGQHACTLSRRPQTLVLVDILLVLVSFRCSFCITTEVERAKIKLWHKLRSVCRVYVHHLHCIHLR